MALVSVSARTEASKIWRDLIERFESREALIGVVGLGYVGLPVAVAFAEAGFRVIGVDVDRDKVRAITEGCSYVGDIEDGRLGAVRRSRRLRASVSYGELEQADAVLISLPTPLTDGVPDLSFVINAGKLLSGVLRPGSLVVLESTTYPGTTEELLQPLLEENGLKAGRDFLLAYSPERIDPGNPLYGFGDIPKVVGGSTPGAGSAAQVLYQQVVPKVVTVSGTREAELAKLIENTFRHVNIALINELAVYAHEMGIDIWDAVEAAATKPFGFVPFWPSPGWGGHCIPLDPAYLSWRVRKQRSHEMRFVELAHAVNYEMPRHVVERISLLLNERGKALKRSRILGIGIAYKAGTEDTRESAGIKVLSCLQERGAKVSYHDPLVPSVDILGRKHRSILLTPRTLRAQDLVVVFTPQGEVDWSSVARDSSLVFDCCMALGRRSSKVVRL